MHLLFGWKIETVTLPKKKIFTDGNNCDEYLRRQDNPEFRDSWFKAFVDLPALYNGEMADLIEAYKKQPENMAFQRLLALEEMRTISQQFLEQNWTGCSLCWRTGVIELKDHKNLYRQPYCYRQQK